MLDGAGSIRAVSGGAGPATEAFVVSKAGDWDNPVGTPQDSLLFYSSHLYNQGFEGFHMGYAAALSYVIVGGVLVLTLVFMWIQRYREMRAA